MSGFALLSEAQLHEGLARLELDLASGAWAERHGALLQVGDLDIGYRLVVAER
jgi:hypothetical protein